MKTIQKGPFLGINSQLPDFSLSVKDKGDYLRDAVNTDIDNRGSLVRRKGAQRIQAMTDPHSLFGEYLVRDFALYRITLPVYSEALLKNLASNARMSWLEFNGDIYFSNGTDSGRIDSAGNIYPWGLPTPSEPVVTSISGTLPIGYYQVATSHARYSGGTSAANLLEESGVSASNNFYLGAPGALRVPLPAATAGATHINVYVSLPNGSMPMLHSVVAAGTASIDINTQATGVEAVQRYEEPLPPGSRVFMVNGRLCVLSGSSLFFGQPFRFGYYLPLEGRIEFPAPVTIAIANQSGVYVAADKTYFIAGVDIGGDETTFRDVLPYGAVAGTEFMLPNKENVIVGWFGEKGVVLADSQGQVTQTMADTVSLTPPESGVSAVFETRGYRRVVSCNWSLNLALQAATRYEGFDFTSISGLYGTRADGLFLIEGTSPVDSVINLGKHDFGSENEKRLPAVYVGCTSEQPLELTVTTPDDEDYRYPARSCGSKMNLHRIDPGRGLMANWFDLTLQNVGGSDFTVASVSFAPVASTRRI